MPREPRTFTVADPTTFDGDPFEVAERALRQAGAVAFVLSEAIEDARGMVANAEMERQIYANGEANIEAFDNGPQARKLTALATEGVQRRSGPQGASPRGGLQPKASAEGTRLMEDEPYIVASTKPPYKPGCVLIQVMQGGDRALFDEHFGGADDWEVSDIESMAKVTESQLPRYLAIREAARG
jgi:hypothetical protein